jgi:hypothetical protein
VATGLVRGRRVFVVPHFSATMLRPRTTVPNGGTVMRFNRLALLSLASQAGCFTPTTNNLPSTTTDTDPDHMGSTGGLSSSGSEGEPESTGTGIEPSESGSADTTTTSTEPIGSSSETTAGSLCGNGTVDSGEECDNGSDNAVDQACLPDCVLNVCGDGMQGPTRLATTETRTNSTWARAHRIAHA